MGNTWQWRLRAFANAGALADASACACLPRPLRPPRWILPAVAAAFLILADARPAQAVSAGCLAVRGGALNISGNFDLNNYQNTFEAGETIVWTITGQPSTQNITIDLGPALTVTGGKATFTFTTSGTHRIDQNLDIGVDPVPTMTAICLETTAEKQDAIRNAIKTLSELQLNQSLFFQQTLLQQLTDTFLTGAVPTLLGDIAQQTQSQIADLQNTLTNLQDQIESIQTDIDTNHRPVIAAYNAETKKRDDALAYIHSVEIDEAWQALRAARKLHREMQPMVDEARAAHAAAAAERTRQVALGNRNLFQYNAVVLQKQFDLDVALNRQHEPVRLIYEQYPRLWTLERQHREALAAVKAADTQLAAMQPGYNRAQAQINAGTARISVLNQVVQRTQAEIGRLQQELNRILTGVGRLPPASPFAASQLQGAMGFASSMSAGGASNGPVQFSGSAGQVSFFADLNAMRRAERERDGLGFNGLGPNNATGLPNADMPYNVWFKGSYSVSDSNQPGADRDSKSGIFAAGAYYVVTPRFMLGTMYRFRDARSTSVAQGSDLDSRGHGAGVYSTWVVTPILSVSGQALYEWSSNDFRRSTAFSGGTSTGQFDATQLIVTGQVQGTFSSGPWWLRPTLAVTYARAEQHSFIDSAGTPIPGQTSERGQLSFGPRIGYKYFTTDGIVRYVEPSVGVAGTWDFVRSDDTTLASGVIIASDVFTAQFSAGLNMQFANAAALSVSFGYSGFGRSQVESLTVSGQLSVPLALQ